MKLLNFSFEDMIYVISDKICADLHTGYTFRGIKHDVLKRQVTLEWSHWSDVTDQPEREPQNISLLFKEVSLLKVKERNNDYPFTEDESVDIIGFIGNESIDIMDGYLQEDPKEGCTHFIMVLVSEASIKISAETAELFT